MSSKTGSDVASDTVDVNDEETDLKSITEREMWLKSYGMMVHTDPGNLAYHKIDSEKLEAHKAAGTPMLYCSLTAMYSCHWKEKRIKFFLPTKKGRVPFPTCSSNISRIEARPTVSKE